MRRSTRVVIEISALAGVAWMCREGGPARRWMHRASRRAGRHFRDACGRVQGELYRRADQRPDPTVSDAVLADRVRSQLGPLVKTLDLPHLHVMVEEHLVVLHGAASSPAEREQIEHAALSVSGVRGTESYLRIGLAPGDTRPSTGRRAHDAERSTAHKVLIDAVACAGVDDDAVVPVLRAVLATFAERLPVGERGHVATHLPPDVKALFVVPRRRGCATAPRHADALVRSIVARSGRDLTLDEATEVARAVLQALRSLVPEEAVDVAAVLPKDLRDLWQPPSANEPASLS